MVTSHQESGFSAKSARGRFDRVGWIGVSIFFPQLQAELTFNPVSILPAHSSSGMKPQSQPHSFDAARDRKPAPCRIRHRGRQVLTLALAHHAYSSANLVTSIQPTFQASHEFLTASQARKNEAADSYPP